MNARITQLYCRLRQALANKIYRLAKTLNTHRLKHWSTAS